MSALRAAILSLLFATACSSAPVTWEGDRTVEAPSAGMTLSPRGELVGDSLGGTATFRALPAVACPGSVRIDSAGGSLFAVWWTPRADSSAHLVSSRSDDGGARWSAVVPVDTMDRGRAGCRRSPPAIAADSATGYVHVSYALQAPEGPGLFFSHSMDRGGMFHAPVPILYGDRLGHTSIAAEGDVVAVAFEDPNGSVARIGLALSRTMGHIFEDRILPASPDNGVATQPLVTIHGRRISLGWLERVTAQGAVFRLRTGTLH